MMVDTYRGQIRLRAWPRNRGPSKSEKVRRLNDWFKGANKLAKVVEPTQQNMAIAMTKGTGLYPRDLILKQMAGGMYDLFQEDGRQILPRKRYREKVVFQGVILQLLITQALITNVLTPIVFPTPVLDTNGFYSPAAPSFITIPAGVPVVRIDAGWNGAISTPNRRQIIALYKNGALWRVQDGFAVSTPAQTMTMGVDVVAEGDTFEIKCLCAIAQSAFGSGRTFMTLNVLEAL